MNRADIMARKKSKKGDGASVSQEEILERLAGMTRELSELRATTVKYTALKEILATAVDTLPTDTRLPGIRDLAQCLGTSLVTTQRAVTELMNERVLYSRPRSGVFVGERGLAAEAEPAEPRTTGRANDHPFRAVFHFATESAAPFQRKFWQDLATSFSRQYPNVTPALHFVADDLQSGRVYDACERYDWTHHGYAGMEDVLDIADFAGSLLSRPPASGRHLPLYYRTNFLFYNETLLEKHKLPAPSYRTFSAQYDYLRGLAPKLERLGFDPKPYSTQEPITHFGGQIKEFCRAAASKTIEPATRQGLTAVIDKLLGFCQLFRYCHPDDDWMQARSEFLRGRVPLFFGYSVDYWELAGKSLPFTLKAYPTLCCDDTFFLWPRVGEISRRSDHPMESMHFLLFLLRDEAQRRFAATGNFGANLDQNLHPEMTADSNWTAAVLQRSTPFQFATPEDYYLAVNVLSGELWRSLVNPASAGETLDRAIQISRSYLKHRPPTDKLRSSSS